MRKIHRDVLENGLGLLMVEEHSLPIVCSTLWYRVGARDEPAGLTGISHFLEHMMFKGSRHFPKGVIDEISLRLGGNNNAFTSYDYTGYYFTFASDRWEIALDIEADRMQQLLLQTEEFEAEKQVVLEELKMGDDNPWEFLRKNVTALAFQRHPYRNPIIGWKEDLQAITPADLTAYHRKYYQPANSFLVITGDIEAAAVRELVREKFGGIQGLPVPPAVVAAEAAPEGRILFQSSKPAHVSRLMVAFHGPSIRQREIYAANVLRYILAEGKTSRLYHRLVEADKVVSSFSIYFEDMKDPSLFMMAAELKEGTGFDLVEKVLFEEIEKIRDSGVTAEEMSRAIRQLEADTIFEEEDISSLAINLGMYECIDSCQFHENFMENIRAVTSADVLAAARSFLEIPHAVIGRLQAEKGAEMIFPDDEEPVEMPELLNRYQPSPAASPRRPTVQCHAPARDPGVNLPVQMDRLANGLTVLLCPQTRIPAVTLGAVVLAGSREDPPGQEGLAYMLGNLLDEGTSRRGHEEIAGFIDQVGGTMETYGSREACGVNAKLLAENFWEGLDLLQELIYDSVFPEDRIEHLRSQILTRIASLEDRPDYLGSREFSRIIYEGTPLSNPAHGYRDTVERLNRDQLRAFYRDCFHPANTVLVLSGDFDAPAALDHVRQTWNGPPGRPPLARQPFSLTRQTGRVEKRLTVKDKEQHHIYLGHLGIRRNNPDYYRLLVLDVILGGGPGFTSRIPKRLRDEMGLAYHTYASICATAGFDDGRFTAYIGTSPEHREVAIEAMLEEIRRIQAEPVSTDELSAAKDYLTGSFVFKFETMSQVSAFMLAAWLHDLGFDYPERFPALIREITAADVQAVARQYLDPENYTLVEVGPR